MSSQQTQSISPPQQRQLNPGDFVAAITALQRTWSEVHDENDWQDVKVIEDPYSQPFLRITRHQPAAAPGNSQRTTDQDIDAKGSGSDESDGDDDDDEALPRPLAPPETRPIIVTYDVIYSQSYRVPVLYLTLKHPSSSKPLSSDDIYTLVVRSTHGSSPVAGALSMTEHPVTGLPVYFVHPCRTQEAMAAVAVDAERTKQAVEPVDFLMLWFGLVGADVGLHIPVAIVEALASRSGK